MDSWGPAVVRHSCPSEPGTTWHWFLCCTVGLWLLIRVKFSSVYVYPKLSVTIPSPSATGSKCSKPSSLLSGFQIRPLASSLSGFCLCGTPTAFLSWLASRGGQALPRPVVLLRWVRWIAVGWVMLTASLPPSFPFTSADGWVASCPGCCQTVLQWILGYTCHLELTVSQGICPGVGLLAHVAGFYF